MAESPLLSVTRMKTGEREKLKLIKIESKILQLHAENRECRLEINRTEINHMKLEAENRSKIETQNRN